MTEEKQTEVPSPPYDDPISLINAALSTNRIEFLQVLQHRYQKSQNTRHSVLSL